MPGQPPRPAGELLFLVLLLGLGAAALLEARRLGGFAGLSGAGFFPLLASGVMVASTAVLILQWLRARRLRHRPAAPAGGDAVLPVRLVVVVALIGGYVALLPVLGFMAATALFLLAALLYLWRRGLWRSLAVTAASLVVVQVIFREVFQVMLPRGTLWPGGFW